MRKNLTAFLIVSSLLSCNSQHEKNEEPESLLFQLVDNRPYIEVEVNGVKGKFIVDTGGVHGMNTDFAEKAGVKKERSFTIQGGGDGEQNAWYGEETTFHIIGTSIQTQSNDPIILNLNAIRDSLSLPFADGVLGLDLFRKYDLSINYPNRRMTFYEKSEYPKDGYDVVPFTFYRNQIPMIKMEIDGVEGEFTVDTGDRSMLTTFQGFYQSLDTASIELSELRRTGYGVGGPIMAREYTLPSVKISDGLQFLSVKTRVPDHSAGAWARSTHAGNLGSGILKDYEVIFDYDKKEMLFKKPPTLSIKEFTYRTTNFDSTTQWYLGRLPFEVIAQTDSSLTLQYQYAQIKFIRDSKLPTLNDYKIERANKNPNGVFKFGFDVPDTQELIKTSFPKPEDLMFGRPIVVWGRPMFLVKDPEGNVIQFFEGGSFWKNSFYALLTDSDEQYDEFSEFVMENGMVLNSDFSNDSTGVNQQNYVQGDIKIELLKVARMAEAPYNQVGASGVQLPKAYKSLTFASSPPLRHHSAGVYFNDNIYLFGGTSINNWTGHSDFWKLHQQRWSRLPAQGPSPRSSHSLFTTPNSKAIYLFGGWNDNQVLGDFWKYENGEWIQINETTPLNKRYSPGIAYDHKNDRIILYGGCGPDRQNYGDTWSFQNGEWRLLSEESSPGERCRPQLAYDEVNEKVLLFGGSGGKGETWMLNGDEWKIVSDTGPKPRYNHVMESDESRKRIVLFGGAAPGGVRFNDTWEWDGQEWKIMPPSDSPSERDMSVMVYDESGQLILLIGGRTPKWNPLNDHWTWNGTNWTKIK
ncbi:kelch repeat-containing protein [Ekhidna sp.]|uniref:kelch repeat-containing protein n=1 Tax=Ekhidna sp. TaxID=2608089 RepID=UPI003516AE6C